MNPNPPDVPPIITPTTPAPTVVTPPRFKFLLAVVVWLSVVLMGTGVTLILPQMFVSTARLQVLPEPGQGQVTTQVSVPDPHLHALWAPAAMIESESVLARVVEALELPQVWGGKYYDGQKLKVSECIALLRGRLDVRVMTNSGLIDIRIYSESPVEAATIANEVAKAYQQLRTEHVRRLQMDVIKALEDQLELQDQKLNRIKADLAGVAEAGDAAPPNS